MLGGADVHRFALESPDPVEDALGPASSSDAKIKSWWHCLNSTCIIKTNASCVEVRDALTSYIDSGDELLVVDLTGYGAWKGFDNECSRWSKKNL